MSKRDSVLQTSKLKGSIARSAEPKLPVLHAVNKCFELAIDNRTYRVANCSPRHDDTMTSYDAKLVKKVK